MRNFYALCNGKALVSRQLSKFFSCLSLTLLGLALLPQIGFAASQPPVGTGIYGTTYVTVCRTSTSCNTSTGQLKVEVYDSQGKTLLTTFVSDRRGSYQQSLSAGQYILKGAPYTCPYVQCVRPFGAVPVTISASYVHLDLIFNPVTGLSATTR